MAGVSAVAARILLEDLPALRLHVRLRADSGRRAPGGFCRRHGFDVLNEGAPVNFWVLFGFRPILSGSWRAYVHTAGVPLRMPGSVRLRPGLRCRAGAKKPGDQGERSEIRRCAKPPPRSQIQPTERGPRALVLLSLKLEDDRSDPEGRHVNGLPSFAGPSARGYAELLVLAVIGRV